MGLTVPDDHRETFEALLAAAHAAYDRNRIDDALSYAKKAYQLDPYSERAAVMFGFANLSKAGGDPFGLAKEMIANNKKKDEPSDPAAAAATLALLAESKGTADTLGALKAVLGVTDAELELMATKDVTDPELPILIPKCVEDARATVERLQLLDDAINAVCRFADPEARIAADYRQGCESTETTRTQQNQVHFLWAFAHLTEALAFNSVLTYATVDPERKKTNLELRVEKLKSQDSATPEALASFVAAVQTVSETLNAVLPVSGACSDAAPTTQLRATLNDMLAVDAAFQRMPGVPSKITAGIKKAMEKIKNVQGQTANVTSQTKALKGDFTKKMSKGLAEKIDALGSNPDQPLPEEQKTQLCSTFATIAADTSASAVCSGAASAP